MLFKPQIEGLPIIHKTLGEEPLQRDLAPQGSFDLPMQVLMVGLRGFATKNTKSWWQRNSQLMLLERRNIQHY